MISVRKAGLGATLKKVQNGPFRVISPTRPRGGGGGRKVPATLPLVKPPMKPVTNVCAENFPEEYKNDLSTWLADLINFDTYFDVKLTQLI